MWNMWIVLVTFACEEQAPVTPMTQCAGPYAGGFEGDVEGEVSAELDEEGRLVVSFDTPEGELVAAGGVLEDGSLAESTGGVDVDGRFDFDLCEADGDWVADKWEGTWAITRQ